MGEDKFFVRVDDGSTIRKSVLELSRDIILVLRRFKNLSQIRSQKRELAKRISEIFEEIENICASMDLKAPDYGVEGLQKGVSKREENKDDKSSKGDSVEDSKISEEPIEQKVTEKTDESFVEEDKASDSDDYEEQMKKIEESAAEIEKKLNELI